MHKKKFIRKKASAAKFYNLYIIRKYRRKRNLQETKLSHISQIHRECSWKAIVVEPPDFNSNAIIRFISRYDVSKFRNGDIYLERMVEIKMKISFLNSTTMKLGLHDFETDPQSNLSNSRASPLGICVNLQVFKTLQVA